MLVERLWCLNPEVVDSVARIEEVIACLVRVRPNKETWRLEHLRGFKTVFVEAERCERNVRLLDAERLEANTSHVTGEFRFTGGRIAIRADTVPPEA